MRKTINYLFLLFLFIQGFLLPQQVSGVETMNDSLLETQIPATLEDSSATRTSEGIEVLPEVGKTDGSKEEDLSSELPASTNLATETQTVESDSTGNQSSGSEEDEVDKNSSLVSSDEAKHSEKDSAIARGNHGSAPWELTSDGTLLIGTGTFANSSGVSPWLSYADQINRIAFIGQVEAAVNSSGLFKSLLNVKVISDLQQLNTTNVTNMSKMFMDMRSLSALDVSSFDTSKVTTMSEMFSWMDKLTTLNVSNFDTRSTVSMKNMFYGALALASLDVSHFDTSSVNDMNGMFSNLMQVTTLDVSNFDTSNVMTMNGMFYGMSSLTTIDVSGFNTSKVTNMSGMFASMSRLKHLDLGNFDTKQVNNMLMMFLGLSELTNLDVSNFDTSNVQTMESMFYNDKGLTQLDLSRFNTTKVTSMKGMLFGMDRLSQLKLGSNFDFSGMKEADLPMISKNATYTGKWQNIGSGTPNQPKGNYIFTSEELMQQYDNQTMADTYVWQPQPKYQISSAKGKGIVITQTEANTISDEEIIDKLALTIVDPENPQIKAKPMLLRRTIQEELGIYQVVVGIEDSWVEASYAVYVVEDNAPGIQYNLAVYKKNVTIPFSEKKQLTSDRLKILVDLKVYDAYYDIEFADDDGLISFTQSSINRLLEDTIVDGTHRVELTLNTLPRPNNADSYSTTGDVQVTITDDREKWIKVTIPTKMFLESTETDKYQTIFSESYEIANKSEVPVKVKIADYRTTACNQNPVGIDRLLLNTVPLIQNGVINTDLAGKDLAVLAGFDDSDPTNGQNKVVLSFSGRTNQKEIPTDGSVQVDQLLTLSLEPQF